jgi:hypothetical protein
MAKGKIFTSLPGPAGVEQKGQRTSTGGLRYD